MELFTITQNYIENYLEKDIDFQINFIMKSVEVSSILKNALSFLDQKNQKVIFLHWLYDMDFAEIAEMMHESEFKVKFRYEYSMFLLEFDRFSYHVN